MHLLGEGLGNGLQLPSIAVQLPSGFTQEREEQALRYLDANTLRICSRYGYIGGMLTNLPKTYEKHRESLKNVRGKAATRARMEPICRTTSF